MPYAEQAFLVRTGISVVFLLVQVVAGIHLIRLRQSGIRISNVLFMSMILYFLAGPILFLTGSGPIRDSIAVTTGAGNIGIGLQLITGYPVIALIVLNLVHRKLRPKQDVTRT